ncbi:MAG: hypothetical protein GTN93_02730, partial [Anaerolineae bacterium]|nr:hypothetical protein [Anaerolineae bacterium]NIQ77018.1 hypothetical protein [Anaerolineae bacterium]
MAITTSAGREADTAAPPASQADVEAAQARDSGGEAEEIDVSVRSEADTGDSIGASTRDARKVVIDEGGEADGSEL